VISELGLDGSHPAEDAAPPPPKPPALSERGPGRVEGSEPPQSHRRVEAAAPPAQPQPVQAAAHHARATELPLNPPIRAAAPPPVDVPIRRATPPPAAAPSYVLFGPEPPPKSAFAAWWARFRRTAFGIARPAPES
jgi:hypothetical protein